MTATLDAGCITIAAILGLAVAATPGAAQEADPDSGAAVPSPERGTPSEGIRPAALQLWARSYFPGRSGDVMIVPAEGVIITGAEGPGFMHGSPWDYDARLPLLVVGSGIRPGEVAGGASHQDVGATLADLLGLPRLPTTAGASLLPRLRDGPAAEGPAGEGAPGEEPAPAIVALLVLDGFRPDFLESHADSVPRLRALRDEGAWFPDARLDVLPSATSVAHANLATGTVPAVHGITGNTLFDRQTGELVVALGGPSAERMFALTVSDRWMAETGGRAVVYAQGGTDYPAAALGGHGACLLGGWPVWVAHFDASAGGWATNPDCYTLPDALADDRIAVLIDSAGGTWLGHELSRPSAARATSLFTRFEANAAVEALETLPFGEDTIPDLFLVNLKNTDYAGHAFGPGSVEMRAIVAEVDRQVGRIAEALERRAGERGFVLFVTADHGMPPEPESPGMRVAYSDVTAAVQERFAPGEEGLVRALDGADNQLYLDRDRLRELGASPADVAAFLEELPYVAAAFPAAEVARAASGALSGTPAR